MVARTFLLACAATALAVFSPAVAAPTKAVSSTSTRTSTSAVPTSTTLPVVTRPGVPFNISDFDLSVDPKQDFDNYVNGGWKKTHPIPADRTSVSAFSESANYVDNVLRNLFEQAQTTRNTTLFANVVKSAMDVKLIEKAGLKPVEDVLGMIRKCRNTPAALVELIATVHREALGVVFTTGVAKDPKTPKNVVYLSDLSDSELNIPRDYFLNATDPIHAEYVKYIARVLTLADPKLGKKAATATAKRIRDLESTLALASLSVDDRDDVEQTYNVLTVANLTATAPNVDWKTYFRTLGFSSTKQVGEFVIVNNPAYFTTVSDLLAQKNTTEVFKQYIRFNFLSANAPFLPKKFATAQFEFFGKTLGGQEQQGERWKEVKSFVEANLPDTIARPFVEAAFSAQDKATAEEIVETVRAAFKDHISTRDWLSAETKQKAFEKLGMVNAKIAYPETWNTYAEVKGVSATKPYAANRRIILAARTKKAISEVGKKPDTNRWDMSPTEVNAYYDPLVNCIVVTAAMMTPPNYYPSAYGRKEDLLGFNYGSMAAGTVGHEFTHGFDNDGRLYDGTGQLDDWWTPADAAAFANRTEGLISQFNGYEVLGLHIDGSATVGENIADLGGVAIGFSAFQNYMAKNGRLPDLVLRDAAGKVAVTLTPEQQFFAGYAVSYRENRREESTRKQVASDVHSPAHFRINGPLSDIEGFWKAYNVSVGPMRRPADKVVNIW
ncbi:uncharacterized protein EV422DRAFT_505867 [Fimicolochytrium jonesii]|uniref:uncharacterized protein n=1 Tax=Fimicolochytrium jonesii TaxID=1396493 RepID=UPI0022FDC55E|nr:uncharacterized protein EV422DRAFT_505867 [Fimicolochytrium jonesii]KAI8821770.1 hypothetical protein EV422DRAFT_505867 [Fimicolochytrium jonesii]